MKEILEINSQLAGAPAGVLVGAFCIAIGYFLKMLPMVNNKYIPAIIVPICVGLFMLISPSQPVDMSTRIYWGRQFIIGALIAICSWQFHAQILKRWIDPKWFNDDGSSKIFTKQDFPPNPPTN